MGGLSRRRTVVLIEGDTAAAKVTRQQLESIGLEVVRAASGREGLALLRQRRRSTAFAAVCVDWHLEGIGGDGVLNALAWLDWHPPVIALTWSKAEAEDALTLGATATLVRPYDLPGVKQAIRTCVKSCRRAPRPAPKPRERTQSGAVAF